MTLEVRQLVIRSELDNGKDAAKAKGKADDGAGEEPCCDEDKANSGDQAGRRARERELRAMLERLGQR